MRELSFGTSCSSAMRPCIKLRGKSKSCRNYMASRTHVSAPPDGLADDSLVLPLDVLPRRPASSAAASLLELHQAAVLGVTQRLLPLPPDVVEPLGVGIIFPHDDRAGFFDWCARGRAKKISSRLETELFLCGLTWLPTAHIIAIVPCSENATVLRRRRRDPSPAVADAHRLYKSRTRGWIPGIVRRGPLGNVWHPSSHRPLLFDILPAARRAQRAHNK